MPGCLRDTIPTLTRCSLHRCLTRHGPAVPCRRTRLPWAPTGHPNQAGWPGRHQRAAPRPGQARHVLPRVPKRRRQDERRRPASRGAVGVFPYAIHTVPADSFMGLADLPRTRAAIPRRRPGSAATSSTASAGSMASAPPGTPRSRRSPSGPRQPRTPVPAIIAAYDFARQIKASDGRRRSKRSASLGPECPASSNLTRVTSSRNQTPRPISLSGSLDPRSAQASRDRRQTSNRICHAGADLLPGV